jgi:cytochrome oxidase Cu insertion factor (SCO1/SenC/PrrC family)
MEEHTTQTEERRSAWLPIVAWILLLATCVFVGWMASIYYRYRVSLAEVRAQREGLKPYRVDAETGRLEQADTPKVDEGGWSNRGVADFSLTDQDGNTVTKADLLGRPWAVCLIFSRCAGHCLEISKGMMEVQQKLEGVDARIVSLTVDPDYDSPDVLKNYAENFGADPQKWIYLTGPKDKVYELILGSFLLGVREQTGADRIKGYEVAHSSSVLHINAEGRIVGKYNGVSEIERNRLVEAIREEAEQLTTQGTTKDTKDTKKDRD